MLALALALLSSFAYGFADFAGGMAARGAHTLRVIAIAAPASLVLSLLLIPILGARWDSGAWGWGVASGVASAAAFGLLYLTLARGPMSVLSPITALVSEAIPVAFGLLLGERLHAPAMVGLPLSMVAVLLISAAPNRERSRVATGALLLALAAGTAIACQLICFHQAPTNSGVAPLVIGRTVTSVIVVAARIARMGSLGDARPSLPLAISAGVLDSVANAAFLFAVRHGELAVVAVITALYPAGTLLLARLVLGERLSKPQIGGLGIAAAAVVLLALP